MSAANRPIPFFLGLIGFSYPEWTGTFYPRGTADRDRLAHLAAHFNAVEVNTTFYAMPSTETVRRWASVTPPDFRFCIKMPQEVTQGPVDGGLPSPIPGHLLHDRTREIVGRFFDTIRGLGDKFGAVLVQFPPRFTAARRDELLAFLDQLPRSVRFAIELRHHSWRTPQTESALRDRGLCWVAADTTPHSQATHAPENDRNVSPPPVVPTTDFLYIRWLGKHGQFPDRRREHLDPTVRLAWWARRLRKVLDQNPQVRTVYTFFSNDFAGHAPTTARHFADLLGLRPPTEPPVLPGEPTLFS